MTRQPVFLEMHHILKGDYPLTVPLADGIDLPALTEGDDAPMFLTLPIATETISRNGVKYARKDVMRIVSAINNRDIIGQKGHLTEAERSHRFDTPSLFWVGAMLDEKGVAWGKAYIPRTASDVREYVRVAKAMNAKVGTSIYGMADINETGEIVGDSLSLEQIDMVNPARVGVIQAVGIPIITQESDQQQPQPSLPILDKEITHMGDKPKEDTQGLISEVEKSLREQIAHLTAESDKLRDGANQLTAISELLGKPTNTLTALRELLQAKEALMAENSTLLESAITTVVGEKVKAEHVRPLITELVRAKHPTKMADVNGSVEAVLAQESIKTLLKQATITIMGEAQQRPFMADADTEEVIHIPK